MIFKRYRDTLKVEWENKKRLSEKLRSQEKKTSKLNEKCIHDMTVVLECNCKINFSEKKF